MILVDCTSTDELVEYCRYQILTKQKPYQEVYKMVVTMYVGTLLRILQEYNNTSKYDLLLINAINKIDYNDIVDDRYARDRHQKILDVYKNR